MRAKIILSVILTALVNFNLLSQITVSGKVTNEEGEDLPGVTIIAKGTDAATISDLSGSYTLIVPEGVSILLFRYIGYEDLELPVANIVNAQMRSSTEIQEVVVNAIGIRREKRSSAYMINRKTSGLNIKGASGRTGSSRNRKKANMINNQNIIDPEFNTEEYDKISENVFKSPKDNPVSTLSIDVDNASYSNVRRFLNSGQLPLKDAVRIEEMINYFTYEYPEPEGEHPFSFTTEYGDCPWNKENKLLHIGIQGERIDYNDLKASNFVFLIDVSGSMGSSNKLPLLKKSMLKLIDNLGRKDVVSMVVYAGNAGLVLPATHAYEKNKIRNALNRLESGGSTAGGAGIKLAYKTALNAFIEGGNNRVILATDGDFNVGTSSTSELVRLVEERRKDDIYLTILGFGMGNYKDGRMEQISNAGNGNYFYIDNIKEADKVFGKEMRANMFTIAKDVKIQIEFNPENVKAFRLIGYENRLLNKEDFNDDTKDAGELGPGHTVTALYEIVPAGSESNVKITDKLRYQTAVFNRDSKFKNELMSLKFRYKPPKDTVSILIEHLVQNEFKDIDNTSDNFRFSASVAAFGMLLRESEYSNDYSFKKAKKLADNSRGSDENAYRKEFVSLISKAEKIKSNLADK